MRIPGLKTAKLTRHWVTSRFEKHALILGYHRIAETTDDPFRICVSPRNFAEHLQVLQHHARPLSLSTLVERMRSRQLPERGVVLTFDDGYLDILQTARPLLKHYSIPATSFIVTGSMGRHFWWDKLEKILFSPATLPEDLFMSIEGIPFEWRIRDAYHPSNGKGWADTRKQLLWTIYERLRNVTPEGREQALAQLTDWSGHHAPAPESKYRMMTEDEIVELAAGDLIEVGSHSVSHPWLASLPEAMQSKEINESKSCLEDILGRQVTSFSYPNGSTSEETAALVSQAGFECACTSSTDVVRTGSDLFQLPRFWIPNWNGAAFERWLRIWL